MLPVIFLFLNLYNKPWCHNRSNALLKSRYIAIVYFLLGTLWWSRYGVEAADRLWIYRVWSRADCHLKYGVCQWTRLALAPRFLIGIAIECFHELINRPCFATSKIRSFVVRLRARLVYPVGTRNGIRRGVTNRIYVSDSTCYVDIFAATGIGSGIHRGVTVSYILETRPIRWTVIS